MEQRIELGSSPPNARLKAIRPARLAWPATYPQCKASTPPGVKANFCSLLLAGGSLTAPPLVQVYPKDRSMKLIDRLRKLGYASYKEYLTSDHWYSVRKRFYASDRVIRDGSGNILCSRCMKPRKTDIHHLTYTSLGNEKLMHLIALCRECHNFLHQIERKPSMVNAEAKRVKELQEITEWIRQRPNSSYIQKPSNKKPMDKKMPGRVLRAMSRKRKS